jgi:hypothetical protein
MTTSTSPNERILLGAAPPNRDSFRVLAVRLFMRLAFSLPPLVDY